MAEDLISFDLPKGQSSIIKVIGVGGGGGNAVKHMFEQGITDVDFLICNTDAQAIKNSPIPIKIQMGETLTQGLGAGNTPEKGKQAAIESLDKITEVLSHNTKMVFITAGMGGGTGTGAAPIIAEEAKDLGILTVGIVTLPFRFEGKRRMTQAVEGLKQIREHVDALLVISNEKIREIHGDLAISDAFNRADNILTVAAKGIAEVITVQGSVNVDFADVKTVMENSGVALMGSATASGENRAVDAIQEALTSPLLNNNNIHGAKNILLNIASGQDREVKMDEITEITDFVQEAAGMNADIIWGNHLDPNLQDQIAITIIATGFEDDSIPELADQKETKKISVPLSINNEKEVEKDKIPTQKNNDGIEKFELIDKMDEEDDDKQLDFNIVSPPTDIVTELNTDNKKVSYANKNNILELENQPAYKRKNIELDKMPEISLEDKEVSKFTITDEDGKPTIREENSFLAEDRD